MNYNAHISLDKLDSDELDFLKNKTKKLEKNLNTLFIIMIIGAFVFSFGGAWENIPTNNIRIPFKTIFSWKYYFITLVCLLTLFSFIFSIIRNLELKKLKKDLYEKIKIIEHVIIERKTFLPHNNTYHFYVNSTKKLSIQVNVEDFNLFEEGDEVNIEYAKNSNVYLGYF